MTTAAPPLLVIAGPTATGKTALSIALALALRERAIHAEIISADSRQVYHGLDVGTAKATATERALVRHHGLDLVEPDASFSVVDFVGHVSEALDGIAARAAAANHRPIALLVGGTGLYLRAVARGIDTRLPSDPVVRQALEQELATAGLEPLATRLRTIAPILAETTDLRNPRRVLRALEIATVAGDRPRPPFRGYPGAVAWLGLDAPRDRHRDWIAARARSQFASGLLEEAADLRRRFDPALPAFSAIGYREAWSVLDGERTLEAAIDEDARRNVAFARRQRTWFRSEPGIEWLEAGEGSEDALVRRAIEAAERAADADDRSAADRSAASRRSAAPEGAAGSAGYPRPS